MEPFYFLENEATADVAFIANGTSMEIAFSNACNAMYTVMFDTRTVELKEEYSFEIKSEDYSGLLYDLLEELLFLFDTEELIFKENIIELSPNSVSLSWHGRGEKYKKEKHPFRAHIKAVTFFGMEVTDSYVKVTLDL